MSWENGLQNAIRDYLMVDELFTRPLQISSMPERDKYHGRSATALEEALDSAFFNINLKREITPFKDANTCPVDYLSLLAIEAGVSWWYLGEPEQTQRETIAQSRDIHKKAGTINGVLNAISSLGLNVSIAASERPYSLIVQSQTILNPELSSRLYERIDIYKSERDDIYLKIDVQSKSKRYRATSTLLRASYYSKTV